MTNKYARKMRIYKMIKNNGRQFQKSYVIIWLEINE